jgi:hypothetical protein
MCVDGTWIDSGSSTSGSLASCTEPPAWLPSRLVPRLRAYREMRPAPFPRSQSLAGGRPTKYCTLRWLQYASARQVRLRHLPLVRNPEEDQLISDSLGLPGGQTDRNRPAPHRPVDAGLAPAPRCRARRGESRVRGELGAPRARRRATRPTCCIVRDADVEPVPIPARRTKRAPAVSAGALAQDRDAAFGCASPRPETRVTAPGSTRAA